MKSTRLSLFFLFPAGLALACGDPAEVSEAYYSAVIAGDYSTTATMFHPEGISAQRSRLDFLYDTEDEGLSNFWNIFGEDVGPDEVRAMTDLEFFEVLHSITTEKATASELMRLDRYEVVGTVMEDEKTAHVLVRNYSSLTLAGKSNFYAKNKPEVYFDVQSMRCVDGHWKIEKDDGVEGLVFALETARDLAIDRQAADQTSE